MRKKILGHKKLLAAGVLLLVVLLYFGLMSRNRRAQESQEFYTVTTGEVIRQIQLAGTIQPLFSEDVASMVNARLKKIFFKDGDLVQKGQLLIQFNEEDLITKLEGDRAKFLRERSKLREVEAWTTAAQYITAKSNLENSEIDFQDKEKIYQQNQELFKLKAISRNDLDRSKSDLDRARSTLENSKASFEETKLKGSKDALQEAKSNFITATIAFQDSKRALDFKEIYAPYSGVVSVKQQSSSPLGAVEKSLSENRTVTPGEVLLTISDRDRFTADVEVDEFDIYKVHLDQACKVTIPALPKENFQAKIVSISSGKSGKGASFQVRCQIEHPSPLLKVGMSANVRIPLEEKKGVLVVPLSALVKRQGVDGVFLAGSKEPVFHPVHLGLTNNELAEVTQGLTAGQKILRQVPAQLSGGG